MGGGLLQEGWSGGLGPQTQPEPSCLSRWNVGGRLWGSWSRGKPQEAFPQWHPQLLLISVPSHSGPGQLPSTQRIPQLHLPRWCSRLPFIILLQKKH